MTRFQHDNAKLEVFRDITDDVEESDFVPYACLIDPNTILTKNGEVLQILKVTGFTYEALQHADADLRKVIRQAVSQSIPDKSYAIWLTTIRRKKSLSPDAEYPDEFSASMHEAWKDRNQWGRKFINELYITIVKEGENARISSPKSFFTGLMGPVDRKLRNAFIDRSLEALTDTVDRFLGCLKEFGARRLTVVQREDGCYYGEHLEFLEKLINLEERPMPLDEVGLSDYLTSGEISFAYNAMEVRSAEGDRRFGTVLTVKEYKEASLYRLDDLLQKPCEFIVTQCLDFVNAYQALQSYKDQHYFLKVSGDNELAKSSELRAVLSVDQTDELAFGEQQTTLFVIGSSVQELEDSTRQILNALADIGIVAVREDVRFEESYWAMLPANFEFVARLGYINTRHIAGFANIQNYPAGNAAGCPWGPPVTLFYTAAGTPYFFNFHLGDNGHTTIMGPHGSGKSVLLNFLLSEARKYRYRLFYLDAHGHADAFVRAIGGNYYHMEDQHSEYHHLSPLSLVDSGPNREFLKLWLTTLIDPTGQQIRQETVTLLEEAVAVLYDQPPEHRNLRFLAEFLAIRDLKLATALTKWYGTGENAHFFDHIGESVEPRQGIIGFNLQHLIGQPELLVPVASYLLHRITMTFDGTPSIVVLDEAWQLLYNPMFAPRLASWLDYIASKNGLVIATTEEMEEAATYPFCETLMSHAATQIYLPDDDPGDAYEDAFGLDEDECAYLEAMSTEYRHFMLKRQTETIIAELNLGGMDDKLAILSGNLPQEEPEAAEEMLVEEAAIPDVFDLGMQYEQQTDEPADAPTELSLSAPHEPEGADDAESSGVAMPPPPPSPKPPEESH